MPFFSIVIAARNAAATLPGSIAALQQQTLDDWEAIVINDGSTDDTALVVARAAEADGRVRLISNPATTGVSAARNAGIAAAGGAWLLCLDADDTVFPHALEAWRRRIDADPTLDAVCGRWVRVAPDGRIVLREAWDVARDMFPTFARLSPFPIHSCVARRTLVDAAGGFDTSFVTCEDWDLWQRLARAGASFGAVDAEVARYHMRPGSASLAAHRMLIDGLRVIATGHSPDPRVTSPLPHYASGIAEDAAEVRFGYACWPAGLVLGSGEDPAALLDALGADERAPRLDPSLVADALFRSSTLPLCAGPEAWRELWPTASPRVLRFLDMLEQRTGAPFLSRRVVAVLARAILQHAGAAVANMSAGPAMLHAADVLEPPAPIAAPPDVERAVVRVEAAGELLGWIELPVCDGRLDPAVLHDAIAFEYGWTILGRFFDATVYRHITVRRGRDGLEAVRGRVVLGPACEPEEWALRRHDLIGWSVFLQELWGQPGLAPGAFYDPAAPAGRTRTRPSVDGWISVDVLDPPCDWTASESSVDAELTIAGVAVCCTRIAPDRGVVRAARLRALLTTTAGVELVHVAVREGLIGRTWTGGTLREHLSGRRPAPPAAPSEPRAGGLSPSARMRLAAARADDGARSIVAARRQGLPGSAASRRADLPASAWRDVIEAAESAGEPVIAAADSRDPSRIAYMPELVWAGAQHAPAPAASIAAPASPFDRHHFEVLFAGAADPWRYTTRYEARKYDQTLSLLPAGSIGRALEIGCAEGHFTELLARRTRALTAVDISAIALERAAARCSRFSNVSFARLDLARDPLPADNDVIVCSEILYYMGSADVLRGVCRKLRDALAEGGRLITAHARVAVDEPDGTGYGWPVPFGLRTIKHVLSETGLRLARELRTELYSVLEFVRGREPSSPLVIDAEFVMPEQHAAAAIRWRGGARPAPTPPAGSILPILTYHRIASVRAGSTARYRVPEEEFARQLAYLRDAGFRTASLAEWTAAIRTRQPLAGRPVALTFDDAYQDFQEMAMPLLQQYGFGATLFVVTGHAGGRSAWEAASGDRAALMDWSGIQRAAAVGIEIGAHSVTHPPLTVLSPAAIVREASRARADLQRHIGRPVTAFAYPYGDSDAVVEHLVGGAGFVTGVTSRAGLSHLRDRPLRLPRHEIVGGESLSEFIRKLG